MKTLTAAVMLSSLALVLAGAIAATFGPKSGIVSFVILLFLISYSWRIMHVVCGCGIPQLIKGEVTYLLPVACELVPAVIVFVVFRQRYERAVRSNS